MSPMETGDESAQKARLDLLSGQAKRTRTRLDLPSGPAKRMNATIDVDVLSCPVCFHPMRPPIFQCTVGHAICSSCLDKFPDKCHSCGLTTTYNRLYVLERLVETIKVACSNNNHGCIARIIYYQKEDHERSCPYAPCFCPETGCGFSGPTMTLLDHFSVEHKWQSSNFKYNEEFMICIKLGSAILVGEDGHLFLVNMILEPHGSVISVRRIQPHNTGPKFKCRLSMKCFVEQYLFKEFYTRRTNLYDQVPEGSDTFYVPKMFLPGNGATAAVVMGVTLKPE